MSPYLRQVEFEVVDRAELPRRTKGAKSRLHEVFEAVFAGQAVFMPIPEEELALKRESIKGSLHRWQKRLGNDQVAHVLRDSRDGVKGLYIWLDGNPPR